MQTINADNPFLAYKTATQFALGCKGAGRPVFKERGINSITLADDIDDYFFLFNDLNYGYVESLSVDDVSVYSSEQYGKFFYEYGRTILANLMICLTKADWNSVSVDSNGEAPYVNNYFNNINRMDYRIKDIVENFKKEALDVSNYSAFNINYAKASEIIKKQKNIIASSKESKDMKNTDIFYCAYIGLMYTLYGSLIILSQLSDEFDIFSFFKSPKSKSMLTVYDKILKDKSIEVDSKKHLMSLAYAFFRMTDFYVRTSGLEEKDPVVGTLYDICENLIVKISTSSEDIALTLKMMVDADLLESYSSVPSLHTFTTRIDPLVDIQFFRSNCTIDKDNTNLFDFGDAYLRSYSLYDDDDYENKDREKLTTKVHLVPAIKMYLEKSMKPHYTDEDVERGFGAVKNLLTGVEDTQLFSKVDPSFILQLILMASTFRVLDNKSTSRSDKAKNMINAGIDIIDTMILRLYQIWFKSNKYYIQPNRPNYCGDKNINSTLHQLRDETIGIFGHYFEFVRFGLYLPASDEKLFEDYATEHFIYDDESGEGHTASWIDKFFTFNDIDTFMKMCATKHGRSLVQIAMFEEDPNFKKDVTFAKIVKGYNNKEIPKFVIKALTKTPENFTGISQVDRVISFARDHRSDAETEPEVYTVVVFAIYWFTIDMLFRKFNTGNYFDFGVAEDSLGSYGIEETLKKLVAIPLKKSTDLAGL